MQHLAFWHEAHVGVDAASGLVHTLIGTAGKVAAIIQVHALLHGAGTSVLGGAGYTGVDKRQDNLGTPVH